MSFTYNRSEEKKYELIEDGLYECAITNAEEKTNQNGTQWLSFTLEIRSEIEQKYQGRKIFYSVFRDKTNPNVYDPKRINRLLDCVPEELLEDGATFETTEDLLGFLNGLYLQVFIKKSYNDFKKEEENIIYYLKRTHNQPKKINDLINQEQLVADEVDTDDLPF